MNPNLIYQRLNVIEKKVDKLLKSQTEVKREFKLLMRSQAEIHDRIKEAKEGELW